MTAREAEVGVVATALFSYRLRTAALCVLASAVSTPALASEGGVGRPITGLQVAPFAGVVPPGPAWVLTLTPIIYTGSAKAETSVPVAGQITLGLEADVSYNLIGLVRVWPTAATRWHFASSVVVPIQYARGVAQISHASGSLREEDSLTSLHDVIVVPVQAGYHFSETSHLSFGLMVYAPTGDYEVGRIANNGMNVWTFVPTVSATMLLAKGAVELSSTAGVEFYTKNRATDYQSGVLWRLDALALKRFSSGLGVGAVAGWIHQLTDDVGGLAALLDGFKGRAFGVGPALTYRRALSKTSALDLNLRWVPDLVVRNRLKGQSLMASGTISF